MQTVFMLARQVFRWESIKLANGAYKIQNVRELTQAPLIAHFTDCTHSEQFCDELECVQQAYGMETDGLCYGLVRDQDGFSEVICFVLPL